MRLAASRQSSVERAGTSAPGGWLLLEHGATQAEEVRRELVLAGMRHVRSHRDLAGFERMTEGQQ